MVYSREEMMLFGRGRHKQYMKYKLGLDRNGKIKAFQSEIHLDGGAYASFGVATTYYAGNMMPTLYHIPNFKYKGIRVVTNRPACGAFRGHGVPQPRFAFECLLTMMAEEMGIDPIEIRMRNSMDPETRTVNDLDIGSCEFRATLNAVREKIRLEGKIRQTAQGAAASESVAAVSSRALATPSIGAKSKCPMKKDAEHFQKKSIFPHANAIVRVTEDGMAAILMIGVAEIGQGAETVMVQMCAEALGIPASRLRIRAEDSDISPIDLGAYSSRITLMGGHAVARAGQDVVERMKPYAAAMLECDPSEVVARDAKMFAANGRNRSVPWEEVARKYFNDKGPLVGTGCYKPPDGLGGDYKGATVGTSPAYSFGSSVCEASVDMETGKIKIEQFTDYHDCGTPINPHDGPRPSGRRYRHGGRRNDHGGDPVRRKRPYDESRTFTAI